MSGKQRANAVLVAVYDDLDCSPGPVDRERKLGMKVRAVELGVCVPQSVPRLEVRIRQPVERNDRNGHSLSLAAASHNSFGRRRRNCRSTRSSAVASLWDPTQSASAVAARDPGTSHQPRDRVVGSDR